MPDFYKTADNPTVFTGTGTAFKTPQEFFDAGGAQDFSNVQTVGTLPFQKAQTLTGEPVNLPGVNIPSTLPAPEAPTIPQTPLPELFSQYRTQAGLPELVSQRQQFQKTAFDILNRTREALTKQEGGGVEQDISITKQRELSRLAERELTPILQGLQLTQEQIKEVNDAAKTQLGLVSDERKFVADEAQRKHDRFVDNYKLQEAKTAKSLSTQIDDNGNISIVYQNPDGSFGMKSIGKIAKEKQDTKVAEEVDDNGNLSLVFQRPDGTTYVQKISGIGKTKSDTVNKYEARDTAASQMLESGKGTDGYVASDTYQNALRKFISMGGTQANFIASFPQQTYLRQSEIEKLPAALQQAQVTPAKNLNPQQLSYINDAKAELDGWKQAHPFQDSSQARQFLIDQIKSQYGFDINPYL
ncbi:MAG: hypothetical protein AAB922_03070 [Patescibacteria group bacterium]